MIMPKASLRQTSSEYNALKSHGYTLLSSLGQGSYAKVYLGEFKVKESGETGMLACKVLDTMQTPKKFTMKFLPRELKILAKLDHPHIVHIHSIFRRKHKYFIFMRHAENGDLLHFIMANGVVHEKQARVWVRQIALALQYLHTKEIAHRDLKCENILVTQNYNVKISDFGFSRFVVNKQRRREESETFCGSLSYAPPEIIKGKPYYPKIADMWSFGVVVYIMLNKSYPFDDNNVKGLYNAQVHKNWRFRSKHAHKYSEEVKKLVCNLLEPIPSKRYNAEQVISSNWIAMDSQLTTLNTYEYQALSRALDESANIDANFSSSESAGRRRTSSYLRNRLSSKNHLMFYKQFQDNELALIKSELNKRRES